MNGKHGILVVALVMSVSGCCHSPEVTCHSLTDPCAPEGIPFYLPKPLLIVSKNFRNIDEDGYGQLGAAPIPNSFDNQSTYADVKANISSSVAPSTGSQNGSNGAGSDGSNKGGAKSQSGAMSTPGDAKMTNAGIVPAGTFKDGVTPDTYFSYQIIFVPDMTQKYAIKIKGGTGEFRAAMNVVNGWMFTGIGPFYMKDSSTAQNILATGGAITFAGRGVADVINSVGQLAKPAGPTRQSGPFDPQGLAGQVHNIQVLMDRNGLRPEPLPLKSFAEIYVYEPYIHDGQMEWRPLPLQKSTFDRDILGIVTQSSSSPASPNPNKGDGANPMPPVGGSNPMPAPAPKMSMGADSSGSPIHPAGGWDNPVMGPAFPGSNPAPATVITTPGAPAVVSGVNPPPVPSTLPPYTNLPGNPPTTVTVNVNPEARWRRCLPDCWPHLCKECQRPRIVQAFTESDENSPKSLPMLQPGMQPAVLSTQNTTGYKPGP
jgi:hypothetical protein